MALQDVEELEINLVFEVIDWYKQAIVLAIEVELEQETIAESQLGVACDKVPKLTPWHAKTFFK